MNNYVLDMCKTNHYEMYLLQGIMFKKNSYPTVHNSIIFNKRAFFITSLDTVDRC